MFEFGKVDGFVEVWRASFAQKLGGSVADNSHGLWLSGKSKGDDSG